jgi:hypothetical protein
MRTAFRTVLLNNSDNKMSNRLTRELMKVLKMDTLNDRGQRKVTEGDLQLLNQFDFNDSAGLLKTFFAPFVPSINRATGKIDVDVAPFAPLNMLAFPEGATHCVLKAAAAEIDFENSQYVMNFSESNPIPLDSQMSPVLNLTQNVTAASTAPIFALFGIEFFQEVNNTQYPLKNGAFNAMAIVQIDQ